MLALVIVDGVSTGVTYPDGIRVHANIIKGHTGRNFTGTRTTPRCLPQEPWCPPVIGDPIGFHPILRFVINKEPGVNPGGMGTYSTGRGQCCILIVSMLQRDGMDKARARLMTIRKPGYVRDTSQVYDVLLAITRLRVFKLNPNPIDQNQPLVRVLIERGYASRPATISIATAFVAVNIKKAKLNTRKPQSTHTLMFTCYASLLNVYLLRFPSGEQLPAVERGGLQAVEGAVVR